MNINNPTELGEVIRTKRVELSLTQSTLALAAGTGLNFVYQLEKGKKTSQVGKVLSVLQALGLQVEITER